MSFSKGWIHVDLANGRSFTAWNCRHDVQRDPLACCYECGGFAPHVYDLTTTGGTHKFHECEDCGFLQSPLTKK